MAGQRIRSATFTRLHHEGRCLGESGRERYEFARKLLAFAIAGSLSNTTS